MRSSLSLTSSHSAPQPVGIKPWLKEKDSMASMSSNTRQRIIEVAKANGFTVELKADGSVLRLNIGLLWSST